MSKKNLSISKIDLELRKRIVKTVWSGDIDHDTKSTEEDRSV